MKILIAYKYILFTRIVQNDCLKHNLILFYRTDVDGNGGNQRSSGFSFKLDELSTGDNKPCNILNFNMWVLKKTNRLPAPFQDSSSIGFVMVNVVYLL